LVTLSEGNAAGAKARTGPKTVFPAGRLDTGGAEYKTTPQSVLGEKLIGWWGRTSLVVAAGTDDYVTSTAILDKQDRAQYGLLAGITTTEANAIAVSGASVAPDPPSYRAGVVGWRNMAKRYDYAEVDSTNPHRDGFADLTSYSTLAPSFVDDKMIFDGRLSGIAGGEWKASRRLYSSKGELVMASATNPCVWVVFKPSGNEVEDSSDPDDQGDYANLISLRRGFVPYGTPLGTNNTETFGIIWGENDAGSPAAADKFWHARGVYASVGAGNPPIKAHSTSTLSGDTNRRVYSARMESEQLVFKVSDTEYTTPSGGSDDLKWSMYNITIGDYVNGEISEVVLTAEQPTTAEISDLESYFSNSYSDLAETL
jgi:hypothetical protein